jgi:uncharacterized membrane protein YdjX (TVP38/TMEM64 family)
LATVKRELPNKARFGLILLVLVLAPLIARATGIGSQFSTDNLRELMGRAGPLGPLLFVALFVAAVVSQVPGFAFVIAAPALFHLPEAWAICFLASNLAVILNFALVRKLGGQPFTEFERPTLRRLFAQLERHPIRTVAVLRTLTVMFPPVTGALALTQLRALDHAIGSAIGMLLPVTALLLGSAALIELAP